MKVRNLTRGQRARLQNFPRHMRRTAHRAVRAFNQRNEHGLIVTFTLFGQALAQARREKRFFRYVRTRAYRRRLDRLMALKRLTGGRIVHGRSPFGKVVAAQR